MKQIISIIILLAIIIGLDTLTILNTKCTMESLSSNINELKENIKVQDDEKIKNSINTLDEKWKSSVDKLSYYIEHNELDKVETEIVTFKADIENKNYSNALESIEKANFMLEHIKEKNQLNLKNIF